MAHPKLKSENYQNFGGINSKSSPYVTGHMQFLNLINFDFQTPGSLTSRWGSTQYMGQTFPGQINSLFEYAQLSGASYVVTSYSGGIYYGATTGQFQGMSLTNVGATTGVTISILGTSLNTGPRYLFYNSSGVVNQGTAGVFYQGDINNPAYSSVGIWQNPAVQSDNQISYQVLNNYLFMADGNKFLKFDGATTTFMGLPPVAFAGVSAVVSNSSSLVGVANATLFSYAFYVSYVNNRGFESQIWPAAYLDVSQVNATTLGGSFIALSANIWTPLAYGISAINVYSWAQSTSFSSGGVGSGMTVFAPGYVLQGTYPASGSTITSVPLGSTLGGQSYLINNVGLLPSGLQNDYYPLGFTAVSSSLSFGQKVITEFDLQSYWPRYLEVYQNRLFCAGFSLTPSTVWFSEAGEPEAYQLENNFEVRTNDADFVTCVKAYSTKLYIFKQNSFHVLLGDNPLNFFLQEISLIYGCLNNYCAVTYNDSLLFLDRKGIMGFNGSAPQCISDPVQPYFDRMNYNVAIQTARMVHDKLRNQILIAIPIDGATQNNIVIVFDYLANAWTTHQGYTPSVFAVIKGYNNTKNVFEGSVSGRVNWFGPSFFADNGRGITTYLKTRFIYDLGESIQKQFRRLYINADQTGTTLNMPLNFYQDYGTSIVLGTTFSLGAFQDRIDFGISAKALAFELSNVVALSPLRIHGFTIEYREQRAV